MHTIYRCARTWHQRLKADRERLWDELERQDCSRGCLFPPLPSSSQQGRAFTYCFILICFFFLPGRMGYSVGRFRLGSLLPSSIIIYRHLLFCFPISLYSFGNRGNQKKLPSEKGSTGWSTTPGTDGQARTYKGSAEFFFFFLDPNSFYVPPRLLSMLFYLLVVYLCIPFVLSRHFFPHGRRDEPVSSALWFLVFSLRMG